MATTVTGPSLGEAASPWNWKTLLCLLLPPCALLAWCAARALEWAWLRPRRLERALRSQGLSGSAYRPPAGDGPLKERLVREARSRPPLPPGCHDVVPRVLPLLHHAMKEHGKSSSSFTWIGPEPCVTIAEPELLRQVLSNKFGHFEKVHFGQLQRRMHNGLTTIEGEKWARHRRILNPAFHLEKLKRTLPAFAACCEDLVRRWSDLLAAGDGGGGGPREVDVWPEMQRLTGDVISRAAFGSSYLEGKRIFELQGEQVRLAMQIVNKLYIPGYVFLPTRINRRMKRIAAEVDGILRGMIAAREKAMKAAGGEAARTSDDLLGLMLESNKEQQSGGGMSTDDVIGECKLFYFAGMETTSVLLTWTLVALCVHPEWQVRAREEVLRVFGRARTPDYDGISRLKTVAMVLNEVLRLYTPLPAVHRRTYKPMEIGGVKYPAGVVLAMPMLQIHHDRDVWGQDADEFRPERFADGAARAASGDGPAFFPFGWGPRTCIGQNFALLEAKMALAMILQNFAFELSPSYAHAPFSAPLVQPRHGAQVMLTRLP